MQSANNNAPTPAVVASVSAAAYTVRVKNYMSHQMSGFAQSHLSLLEWQPPNPLHEPRMFSQSIRISFKTQQVSGGGAGSGQLNAAPEPGATPNGPSGGGLLGSGTAGSGAALSANAKAAAEAPPTPEAAAATAACHAALVNSPAASCAALANHRAAIDPALAKILEIVGGYPCAVIHFTFFLSFCTSAPPFPLPPALQYLFGLLQAVVVVDFLSPFASLVWHRLVSRRMAARRSTRLRFMGTWRS